MSEAAFGLPIQSRPRNQITQVRSLPKLLKGDRFSNQQAKPESYGNFPKIDSHYGGVVDQQQQNQPSHFVSDRMTNLNRNADAQTCGTEMRIDINAVLSGIGAARKSNANIS